MTDRLTAAKQAIEEAIARGGDPVKIQEAEGALVEGTITIPRASRQLGARDVYAAWASPITSLAC